jgi:hypothetical protein
VAPVAQAVPQVPQFASSVSRFTQAPPQTDSSAGHWHAPEAQVAPVAQAVPHPPQFASSAWRSTHAVGAAAGHAVVPAGHVHVPASHTSPASGHTFPQAAAPIPQFRGSVRPSTQRGTVEQDVVPGSHAQAPETQAPRPQAIPHPPQLAASLA